MSGRFVTEASITVPLLGRNLDANAIAADPELSRALRSALDVFCVAIAQRPAEGDVCAQCASAARSRSFIAARSDSVATMSNCP